MDVPFQRKIIKLAIGAPLAFSVALVLDIDINDNFYAPLMLFIVLFYMSGSVALKRSVILVMLTVFSVAFYVAAFINGLWGLDSFVIFFTILLLGGVIQAWIPAVVRFGMMPVFFYQAMGILLSTSPYTAANHSVILLSIGFGAGMLAERLFWPVSDEQLLRKQVSQTFRILGDASYIAFDIPSQGSDLVGLSCRDLEKRAAISIRTTNKALGTAVSVGSLSSTDREEWLQLVVLQARLLAQLVALGDLLQDNRHHPLLQECESELNAIGNGLSQLLLNLSTAAVSKTAAANLSTTIPDLQPLQSRWATLKKDGTTQTYDLPSRLSLALIERRLQTLEGDLTQTINCFRSCQTAVPSSVSIGLASVG